jgi:hypothetical protein
VYGGGSESVTGRMMVGTWKCVSDPLDRRSADCMKSGRESRSALLHMVSFDLNSTDSKCVFPHSANTPSISLISNFSSGMESTSPSGINTVP